jgi:hypothetical protein
MGAHVFFPSFKTGGTTLLSLRGVSWINKAVALEVSNKGNDVP